MSLWSRGRDALPLGLRRAVRRWQRARSDAAQNLNLAPPPPSVIAHWPRLVRVAQPLTTTPHAGAKRANIQIAAAAVSGRPIVSGQIFSFWAWVGEPSARRGFLPGRALRNGRTVLEPGGGLCQLAGALYFAALQAGFETVERHAHSVDLYTDETRYAPLGSDATILYGFKDLRLVNRGVGPMAFAVEAGEAELIVSVHAPEPIAPQLPEFRVTLTPNGRKHVETWSGGRLIASSIYDALS